MENYRVSESFFYDFTIHEKRLEKQSKVKFCFVPENKLFYTTMQVSSESKDFIIKEKNLSNCLQK